MEILILLVFGVLSVLSQDNQSDPIIQLPYGRIRGHVLKSEKNRPYYAFQDVPYAKPPIGNLRFKEAQPPESWQNIKNTTANKKKCVIFSSTRRDDAPEESEDCLYATVYTPQLPDNNSSKNLLPVFFVVYGGAFIAGNGDINFISPKFFMDYNVIIVVSSYRLGPLGFLYEGNDIYDGNIALKDVNSALKWTKQNIAQFGGDPNKITMGGISAGAAMVAYQIMSKRSAGLFRGVILQSGTALCGWSLQKNPRQYPHKMANLITANMPSNITSQEIYDILRGATIDELKYASSKLFNDTNDVWMPVLESNSSKDPFITESVLPNLSNGKFNQAPLIAGFDSEEYIYFTDDDWIYSTYREESEKLDSDNKFLVNEDFPDLPEDIQRYAGAEMKSLFTNKTFAEDAAAFIKFKGSQMYKNPVIRHAELQSKYTDVYLYGFAHKGPLGNKNSSIPVTGTNTVGHSEEETFMYGRQTLENRAFPSSDKLAQERVIRMWTNFIIYLDPTPAPLQDPLLQEIKWPTFDQNDPMYLNINSTLHIANNFNVYKNWKAIVEKYEQLQN